MIARLGIGLDIRVFAAPFRIATLIRLRQTGREANLLQ
jgi:hypothetical protein